MFSWALFLFLTVIGAQGTCDDPTLTPRASGSTVVNMVIEMISNSNIFSDDHGYLKRIAYAESRDGTHPNTYREGYYGGIWQVDKIAFEDTQDVTSHPGLVSKHDKIRDSFGIDWPSVQREDLEKPLYSGLASRLYISNSHTPIPETRNEQAELWKKEYNTAAGKGDASNFPQKRTLNDTADYEAFLECPPCDGEGNIYSCVTLFLIILLMFYYRYSWFTPTCMWRWKCFLSHWKYYIYFCFFLSILLLFSVLKQKVCLTVQQYI